MKRFVGLLSVIVLLAACHRPVETRHGTSLPPALTAIDTLMQTRPDSALTLLLEAPVDDPYYQLLLSEALYKNDSAQRNRKELLDAMAYYDSVGCPFLAARCHYMNGVGFYETDSVVPACEEYLRALEIMEDHFDEKDLVGPKAKFMALTYTRLTEIFSNQYLHVQTVEFAKKAYEYFNKHESLSWQSAWALNTIGMNYSMLELLDSAALYYQKAITVLNDTNCLIFRDISEQKALMEYEIGVAPERVLFRLKYLLSNAESNEEYYARCLAVGDVFYHEKEFDSAKIYLEKLFKGDASTTIKKQSAEWLTEIYKIKGDSLKILQFADYLVPFANLNENQGFIKSQLADVYQDYAHRKKRSSYQLQAKRNHKRFAVVLGVFLGVIVFVAGLYVLRTKQLKNERYEHRMKSAALAGRLKQSNAALKSERERASLAEATIPIKTDKYTYSDFNNEPVCRHIIKVCNDEKNYIKSNIHISSYSNIALNCEQIAQLKDAANRHFGKLFEKLGILYPELKYKDYLYCYLCLLGLDNIQIAAMMKQSYRTIWEREKRLQKLFNTDGKIMVALQNFLKD